MPTIQLILVVSGALILCLGIGIGSLAAVCMAFYLGAAAANGKLGKVAYRPHFANMTPSMVDHGRALRERVDLEKELVNPFFGKTEYENLPAPKIELGKAGAFQTGVTSGRAVRSQRGSADTGAPQGS